MRDAPPLRDAPPQAFSGDDHDLDLGEEEEHERPDSVHVLPAKSAAGLADVVAGPADLQHVNITLRLPNELHRAITASANRNERNVAQEIRHAIRRYLAT